MEFNILLLVIIVLETVILVLYIRTLHKEIKIHYSNYYESRMEVIELQDELELQKRLTKTFESGYDDLKRKQIIT